MPTQDCPAESGYLPGFAGLTRMSTVGVVVQMHYYWLTWVNRGLVIHNPVEKSSDLSAPKLAQCARSACTG